MDIIVTDKGQIVLVVPGAITGKELVLEIFGNAVTLSQDREVFVNVTDIDSTVLDRLASNTQLGLIAVPDEDKPPARVTHYCTVIDKR